MADPIVIETEPEETEFVYQEKFTEVPLYWQQDYPKTRYGNYGTVSSHGCGITSLAMVLSYLFDEDIMPDELAAKYGQYNTKVGSSYTLFSASAADYGIEVKQVWDWNEVFEALEDGHVVISNPKTPASLPKEVIISFYTE